MTNFTIGTLIENPEFVESIPSSQVSVILSAVTNHAAAVQSRLAAVQSRLAARILSDGLCATGTDDDRMLTAEEAAKCLNYRLQYVYQLVRENRLGAKREGRKIRIRWGDLKVYMRDGTPKPADGRIYSPYSHPHRYEVTASQKLFERELPRKEACASYAGKVEDAEASLVSVFHTANKGLAHITAGLVQSPEQADLLEIASRGIPTLVVKYLYTRLQLPPPPYKLPRGAQKRANP